MRRARPEPDPPVLEEAMSADEESPGKAAMQARPTPMAQGCGHGQAHSPKAVTLPRHNYPSQLFTAHNHTFPHQT